MNIYYLKKTRISNRLGIILLSLYLISCLHDVRHNPGYSCQKNSQNAFPFQYGINISHWLSQNPNLEIDLNNIFTETDAKLIAEFGYDHLRIPIDEEHLWAQNGNKQPEAFHLLHQAFAWCRKYNMCVVLDLHQIRSHTFNNTNNLLWESSEAQNHFVDMWMQLSDEFVKYPVDFLAYELLNEAVANDPDDWNKLLNITIDSLRKLEPCRKIIIGSNRWQSPDTFDELKIPENDTNIILSFHFYEPFILTHYRTHWTDIGEYVGTVRYPGQVINPEYLINYEGNLVEKLQEYTKVFNKDSLLKNILEPIDYARKYGLQLYCGEFGCTPNVYRSDRLNWYSDVCEIFRENNIAWANWDYKGAFAIINLQNGNPDKKLIDILMGSSE